MPILLGALQFLLSPIGRYVAYALIALAAYGTWDLYIRHDEKAKIEQKQTVERQHVTEKGNTARKRATQRFDAGRLHDDGFARD